MLGTRCWFVLCGARSTLPVQGIWAGEHRGCMLDAMPSFVYVLVATATVPVAPRAKTGCQLHELGLWMSWQMPR